MAAATLKHLTLGCFDFAYIRNQNRKKIRSLDRLNDLTSVTLFKLRLSTETSAKLAAS